MASINLTQGTYELLLETAGENPSPTQVDRFVWDLCLAYSKAKLAASPRPGRSWQSAFAPYGVGPIPAPDGPDRALQVAVHLSLRQGLVTDFQGVTVTACAHAPACGRLSTALNYEVEIVPCEGFDAWLRGHAERGAEAERARSEADIEAAAATESCKCLEGTPGNYPNSVPAQPDDLIFIVGTELADRYEQLFLHSHFGTHPVGTLQGVADVKSIRWMDLGPEEICSHGEAHVSWDDCSDVTQDLTFECDRGCHDGCDWVLYPLDGRARLAIHGNDIDLGPLEEDHTAELTDHLLPQLRI